MAGSIREIAIRCGVSEGTVDRALNNRSGIKEETKKRILEVAREMDYQPNHLARCLATGHTKTIGVVCFNLCDSFFSSLISVIESTAKKRGYVVTIILTQSRINLEEEAIAHLSERKVDGIILFSSTQGKTYVEKLKALNIPIVTIYNRLSSQFVHIDVDSEMIMKQAVSFICEKGYTKVAYLDIDIDRLLTNGGNAYSFMQRRRGYQIGASENGLEEIIFNDFSLEKIVKYIKKGDDKKAILCSFDSLAVRTLSMCRQIGFRVPDRKSVV